VAEWVTPCFAARRSYGDRHRRFADALDGLIVVDLRNTDAGVLERYMGQSGATRYLRS
jgi:hypothetical protein